MTSTPARRDVHPWVAELPYGIETLAATAALIQTWSDVTFQRAMSRSVEKDPDLQVQFLVRHLLMFGACQPRGLAEVMGMSRSNVSKIIGRAESRDLVERRGLTDGRAVALHLTDRGVDLARKSVEVGDRMMQELTADWTDAERRSWTDLSRRLARAAAEYARTLTE